MMRDLLLGALALGDVVMGGDPAAVGHRVVEHGDGAPVGQVDQLGIGVGRERFEHLRDVFVDVAGEVPIDWRCASSSRSVQPGFTTSRDRPYMRR